MVVMKVINIKIEVDRTLKPGAPVLVTTVIHGEKGLLKHAPSRQHMKIFEITELREIVYEAGSNNLNRKSTVVCWGLPCVKNNSIKTESLSSWFDYQL